LHRIRANQKTHVIIDQLLEKHPQGVVLQGVSLPLYESYFETPSFASPRRGKPAQGGDEQTVVEHRIKEEEEDQTMEYEEEGLSETSAYYPAEPRRDSLSHRVDEWRRSVCPGNAPDGDPRFGVHSDEEDIEYPSSRSASVSRHESPVIDSPETKRLVKEMPVSDFARRVIDTNTGTVKRWSTLRPTGKEKGGE